MSCVCSSELMPWCNFKGDVHAETDRLWLCAARWNNCCNAERCELRMLQRKRFGMAGTSSGVHRTCWLPRVRAQMATDRAAEAHIPQSVPVPAERVRPGNCHHRNAAWTRVEPLSCLRRAGDTQYAGSLSPPGAKSGRASGVERGCESV